MTMCMLWCCFLTTLSRFKQFYNIKEGKNLNERLTSSVVEIEPGAVDTLENSDEGERVLYPS